MTNIYNIEVFVSEKSAVINSLHEELTTIKTTKKVSLKEKTSFFSKSIQKLDSDVELIYLNDSDKKGWTKVLTYERKFRIYKNKKA